MRIIAVLNIKTLKNKNYQLQAKVVVSGIKLHAGENFYRETH
jgi:hypothetical protein